MGSTVKGGDSVFRFAMEVTGDFDAKELWFQLEPLKVNLMNLIEYVYVYGDAELPKLTQVIGICKRYGTIKCTFYERG